MQKFEDGPGAVIKLSPEKLILRIHQDDMHCVVHRVNALTGDFPGFFMPG
jgi:hypothetical protein